MAVSFSLPQPLESDLRSQVRNLDQAAKQALLAALYRQGKLSHRQLGEALELSRYETDGVLKQHEVFSDESLNDVLRDAEVSRQARSQ